MNPTGHGQALGSDLPAPVLYTQPASYDMQTVRVTVTYDYGDMVFEFSYLTCLPTV